MLISNTITDIRMTSLSLMQMFRPVMRSMVMTSSPQKIAMARMMSTGQYEFIKTDTAGTDGRVGLVTLNRPKALNALCAGLMDELIRALNDFDNDPTVGAIVVTGSEKVIHKTCYNKAVVTSALTIDRPLLLVLTLRRCRTETSRAITKRTSWSGGATLPWSGSPSSRR